MKFILKILVLGILIHSCKGQTNFDLTQIVLKKDKVSDLVSSDMKKQIYPIESTDLEYMNVRDSKFLTFKGVNLEGQQHPDSNNGVNGISFYYNKKDNLIYKYVVYVFSEEEAVNLLNIMKIEFGIPSFQIFEGTNEIESNEPYGILWERETDKILYMLEYSENETIKAKLTAQYNYEDIVKLNILPPFGCWSDYLKERKSKNKSEFSYGDFLKEREDPLWGNDDDFCYQNTK